ncbi:hypothetical protein CPB97_004670, partial [Podila verticillata]
KSDGKDHSHHKQASGSSNQEKRAVADKNIDTELAFHRRISRNRKTQNLGQKKNKRVIEPETLVNDQEYTVIRSQEPQIKSQDIKSPQKQNEQRKD